MLGSTLARAWVERANRSPTRGDASRLDTAPGLAGCDRPPLPVAMALGPPGGPAWEGRKLIWQSPEPGLRRGQRRRNRRRQPSRTARRPTRNPSTAPEPPGPPEGLAA